MAIFKASFKGFWDYFVFLGLILFIRGYLGAYLVYFFGVLGLVTKASFFRSLT